MVFDWTSVLTGQNCALQVFSISVHVGQFGLQGHPIWHSRDHSFATFLQSSKSSGNKSNDSYFAAKVSGSGRAVGNGDPVVISG